MSTPIATVGFILLLIAFVLYLLALFQAPQPSDPRWQIDRVTTAQALVVLWLLLAVGDGLYQSNDKPRVKGWWFHSNVHRILNA